MTVAVTKMNLKKQKREIMIYNILKIGPIKKRNIPAHQELFINKKLQKKIMTSITQKILQKNKNKL